MQQNQTCAQGAGRDLTEQVVVCWYDQSNNMFSRWANRTMTQQYLPQDKKKEGGDKKLTKNKQSFVQLVGQARHKHIEGHKIYKIGQGLKRAEAQREQIKKRTQEYNRIELRVT